MTTLSRLFEFRGYTIRTLIDAARKVWFVAIDACRVLDLNNTTEALRGLDGDEFSTAEVVDSAGRKQEVRVVSESGLYALAFKSRKDEAEEFRRWVRKEVLPSINKTGGYHIAPQYKVPSTHIEAVEALLASLKNEQRLAEENEALRPRAAFADQLTCSKGSVLIGVAAKLLKIPVGPKKFMGQNQLFARLREEGILYLQNGSNLPYQKYIDDGYFEVKVGTRPHPDGVPRTYQTIKVTPDGLRFIWKTIVGKGADTLMLNASKAEPRE